MRVDCKNKMSIQLERSKKVPLRKSDNRKLKQIVILCLIFSFLYLENSLSYQIVKQETIGPGEVELVRFGFTPEGIAYPRCILFSNRIEMRDAQKKPLVQRPLVYQKGEGKWISISKEGLYFAWIENNWKDRYSGTQVITLYNDTGQVVQTYTWPIFEGIESPYFEISDYDGTLAADPYIYGDGFDTLLYRPDGREVSYSEWARGQEEGTPSFLDFDFASQAPLLGAIGGRSGRGKVSVMLFDLDGNRLWEQGLKKENRYEMPRFIRLSPKGSFLLVGTVAGYKKAEGTYTAETRLYLFNQGGQLLMKHFFSGDWSSYRHANPGSVYAVGFSPQEQFLGVGLLDTVIVWDLTTGAEVYRASLPDTGGAQRQMLRISVNNLGEVLVLTGNWEKMDVGQSRKFLLGAHPQAFLFSSEGQLLWKEAFQAPAKGRIAPPSPGLLKPEIRSRSDLEARLMDKDIYLFIDNTLYHIKR